MADRTAEILASMRQLIQSAKAVPMSASCMVNRSDLTALIDRAAQALSEDLAEAGKASSASPEEVERAREDAARIVRSAEEKAAFLVSQAPLLAEARRKAALLENRAVRETAELRREADAYVDSRIAAFEAGLQKTLTQVQTMRARLASRSDLDGETQTLPRQTP